MLFLGYDETDVILVNNEGERQPTLAFNAMIEPLKKVPLKVFIWYQGESNADNIEDAVSYGTIFKQMIISWCELWRLGDIPFLWVQLPNEGTVAVEDAPSTYDAWLQLRAGQSRAL